MRESDGLKLNLHFSDVGCYFICRRGKSWKKGNRKRSKAKTGPQKRPVFKSKSMIQ